MTGMQRFRRTDVDVSRILGLATVIQEDLESIAALCRTLGSAQAVQSKDADIAPGDLNRVMLLIASRLSAIQEGVELIGLQAESDCAEISAVSLPPARLLQFPDAEGREADPC